MNDLAFICKRIPIKIQIKMMLMLSVCHHKTCNLPKALALLGNILNRLCFVRAWFLREIFLRYCVKNKGGHQADMLVLSQCRAKPHFQANNAHTVVTSHQR